MQKKNFFFLKSKTQRFLNERSFSSKNKAQKLRNKKYYFLEIKFGDWEIKPFSFLLSKAQRLKTLLSS